MRQRHFVFYWYCLVFFDTVIWFNWQFRTVKVRSVANEVIFCHIATSINKISHDYTCTWYHRFLFIFKQISHSRGESTQQSHVRGGFALRSNPLPFYTPFFTEKAGSPFAYVYWKKPPFTYLQRLLQLFIHFNCCKCTALKYEYITKPENVFSIFNSH